MPDDAGLADAARAIAAQTLTFPYLAYLRDKALLFSADRSAFVMYAVQGRTWVALGDPVGPEKQFGELIRRFLERCDDFGGVPVFYEIGKTHLHRYADFGLAFAKLGEEAKEGGTFRIVEATGVPAIIDQLRAVSNDWLAAKASAEKSFSLGFFDEAYLSRFPIAVIGRGGRIQAFANIWPGPQQVELSIDLMRYHRDAPKNVMEALFAHLMARGKQQGYRRFALGMAPLSGFENSPVATIWNRLGAFLYEHGDAAYHFQGLRAYKDKFNPVWEPHYLAYPGNLRLPRVLADVSALVAGGYRKIFSK